MKLFMISQSANTKYDTYDSAIVAAKSEDEARMIVPGGCAWDFPYSGWCTGPDQVTVTLIGTAIKGTKEGMILGSFNAG